LESNQQARDQMRALLTGRGQTLVEVLVHPDEDVRPRVGAKIVEGRIISGNMRDYN
jgi:hypothetical protein